MKSTLSRSGFNIVRKPQPQADTHSLKLIVFDIGKLTVACPIERVKKIINRTPVHGSGLSHIGITHFDDHEVTVVDLHQRLFGSSQTNAPHSKGYLVIVQNAQGELFSIPTASAPTLMEAPLSRIRALPESYRRSDTLEIASHVAMIPQAEESLTIFLLDVNRLL